MYEYLLLKIFISNNLYIYYMYTYILLYIYFRTTYELPTNNLKYHIIYIFFISVHFEVVCHEQPQNAQINSLVTNVHTTTNQGVPLMIQSQSVSQPITQSLQPILQSLQPIPQVLPSNV